MAEYRPGYPATRPTPAHPVLVPVLMEVTHG